SQLVGTFYQKSRQLSKHQDIIGQVPRPSFANEHYPADASSDGALLQCSVQPKDTPLHRNCLELEGSSFTQVWYVEGRGGWLLLEMYLMLSYSSCRSSPSSRAAIY